MNQTGYHANQISKSIVAVKMGLAHHHLTTNLIIVWLVRPNIIIYWPKVRLIRIKAINNFNFTNAHHKKSYFAVS
jgi:hypothetical protein